MVSCSHSSVCLSVCHIMCIVSKRINIVTIFSPSDSHTILVFPHQTLWQHCNGDPPYPNGGVECWWVGKNRNSRSISGFGINDWWSVINSEPCLWQQGSTLFLAIDGEAEQNRTDLILHTEENKTEVGKSKADLTNNKRQHLMYCTAEANYRQIQSIT